jgi:hypothetical protein
LQAEIFFFILFVTNHFITYHISPDLLMGEAQVILCTFDIAVTLFILNNGQCILFQVNPIGMESCHRDAEGNDYKVPIKLKTFVELTMDIASASPRRYFFEARMLYVFCSSIFKQTKDAILCNMLFLLASPILLYIPFPLFLLLITFEPEKKLSRKMN